MAPILRDGRDRGVFNCRANQVIAGRFRVLQEAGAGNFSRVVKAVDLSHGNQVAVKILKREYARDAAFELQLLKAMLKHDPSGVQKVARMKGNTVCDGCPCFIFELLGPNLKSRNTGHGQQKQTLARFMHQMATALRFLHFECRIIHTDLKPENILVDSLKSTQGIGDAWTICDFGSASFYTSKPDQDLISTRPYRAPEVVLGLPWSYAVDVWSLGCILYELARGVTLFDASTEEHHLYLLEKHIGQIPQWLARSASPKIRRLYFDNNDRLLRSKNHQRTTLDTIEDPDLASLLKRCFCYDPVGRIRADEILHHPFIKKYCPSTDILPLISKLPSSGYTSQAIKTPTYTNTVMAPSRGSVSILPQDYQQPAGSKRDPTHCNYSIPSPAAPVSPVAARPPSRHYISTHQVRTY